MLGNTRARVTGEPRVELARALARAHIARAHGRARDRRPIAAWLGGVAAVGLIAGACTQGDDAASPGGGGATAAACSTEGATEYCYPGPAVTRGIGLCADGTHVCTGGLWGECEGYTLPAAELCDDLLDNNCDGVADEGCPCEQGSVRPCYTGPSLARGVGICVVGEQSCVAGTWSSECVGQVLPAATEPCNELDDDCNGIVDEGCSCTTGATLPCYTGPAQTRDVGLCHQGSQHCVNGQWETTCSGETTPTPEICNLLDDDCDGSVDEQLGTTSCGTGSCTNTVSACINGEPQACEPLCDGVSCTSGSQCATGFCKDGRCCDTACTAPCNACVTGLCTPIINAYDDPECTGASSCDASGSCKKVTGQSCASPSECVSGYCKDSRCCNSSCDTPCHSCASGSCSPVANAADVPECSGANSCDSSGICRSQSPFYTNSFESPDDLSGWAIWHNCAADSNWSVVRDVYPAPSGGSWGLRFHTTGFQASCSWPGGYAQSASLAATAGATYRVELWSRNASNAGLTALVFLDSSAQVIGYGEVAWPADAWVYHSNPSLVAVAPPSTAYLQIRLATTTPGAYADCDLLEVYLDP